SVLRSLCPDAPLVVCLLWEKDRPCCAMLDGSGAADPQWDTALCGELTRPGAGEGGADSIEVPGGAGLPASALVGAEVAAGSRPGMLGVGTGPDATPEDRAVLRGLLGAWADSLALELRREEAERQRPLQQGDRTNLTWLANQGELAGPLVHEFNNFL